jgi:hypothetical protein
MPSTWTLQSITIWLVTNLMGALATVLCQMMSISLERERLNSDL